MIAETMSAKRLGVARHCGDTFETRGHGTCSHRGRLSRSASESSHRGVDCHRAGQHHSLRAPVPTHATFVPFLVPSPHRALGHGTLGHGALARARARALHNCRCQVPSVDGYESDWTLWSWWANESVPKGSVMPVTTVWAVVTGREVAHTHWSDAHAVRVLKYGNQADIHGTWET